MTRKLERIGQGLTLPAEQGEVMRSLVNKKARSINGLLEYIHEALMDYQVHYKLFIFYHI